MAIPVTNVLNPFKAYNSALNTSSANSWTPSSSFLNVLNAPATALKTMSQGGNPYSYKSYMGNSNGYDPQPRSNATLGNVTTGAGAPVPGEPTFQMPSTQTLDNQYTSHYNTIMNALNPSVNKLNEYNTQGQNTISAGIAANTASGNQNVGLIRSITNNAVNSNNQQTNQAETGFSNAALASENSIAGLMKSAQGANIGALNAQAGASGFSSGINEGGDPYVRAEQAAMNQPYYQQLTTLNNNTLQAIQSNVSNLTGIDLNANVTLKSGEQTSVTNILNNVRSNNTALDQASATLNAQIAQDYTNMITTGTATAGQLENYQTTLQAQQWVNTVNAYNVSANLLNFINTFTVDSTQNTIKQENAVTQRLNTLVGSVRNVTGVGGSTELAPILPIVEGGKATVINPFLSTVTGGNLGTTGG